MLAVLAGLTLSGAAWHSVSAASSDLTQHAGIGSSQSADAHGNSTNHRNLDRFLPPSSSSNPRRPRRFIPLGRREEGKKKRIERDGKQQQENKKYKMGT